MLQRSTAIWRRFLVGHLRADSPPARPAQLGMLKSNSLALAESRERKVRRIIIHTYNSLQGWPVCSPQEARRYWLYKGMCPFAVVRRDGIATTSHCTGRTPSNLRLIKHILHQPTYARRIIYCRQICIQTAIPHPSFRFLSSQSVPINIPRQTSL